MDIDKTVDKVILEELGFPGEVIGKVEDLDALIKEAKAIADVGKAEKVLQFLGMDVSDLGGDVVDKTAVALDKLLNWAASKAKGDEKSPELAKMKADAEKRRGKKIESKDKKKKAKGGKVVKTDTDTGKVTKGESIDFDKAVDDMIECELSDKVKEMKQDGMSQDEIAMKLSGPDYNYDADTLGEVIVKVFREET